MFEETKNQHSLISFLVRPYLCKSVRLSVYRRPHQQLPWYGNHNSKSMSRLHLNFRTPQISMFNKWNYSLAYKQFLYTVIRPNRFANKNCCTVCWIISGAYYALQTHKPDTMNYIMESVGDRNAIWQLDYSDCNTKFRTMKLGCQFPVIELLWLCCLSTLLIRVHKIEYPNRVSYWRPCEASNIGLSSKFLAKTPCFPGHVYGRYFHECICRTRL